MFLNTIARYWALLCLFLLSAITIFSLTPLAVLPEFPGSDKTHHFVAYGLLIFPMALRQPKQWVAIAFIFVVWSGAIELLQPYVNRYAEWTDLAANCAGLLIGALFGIFVDRVIQKPSSLK